MSDFRATLVSLPARLAEGLVWIYQKTVSPALAVAAPSCGCRFAPTCSHYAREALREHGLLLGLALTFRRLVKCAPWHPGGLDPVPPARRRPVCARVTPA
ncbi:MAG: membrane protein insertion efficiency factor YidD [Opitutae bacterium]|nr:membrane protein insertion efficiency factor YidD [Opitutae bacterium]